MRILVKICKDCYFIHVLSMLYINNETDQMNQEHFLIKNN